MRRKHLTSKRKGVTLILALMVMSAVIAIGITIVAIVVFQTRINATTTQGQQGYYAAESGIEQALSKVVGLRSGSLAAAESELKDSVAPSNSPYPFNLDLTTAVSSGTVVQKELKQNQSAIVEIYDVDDSITPSPNLNTAGLCVYAEGSGDEILEISWVAWLENTGVVSATQRALVAHSEFSLPNCVIPSGTFSGFRVPLTQFYPAFPGNYAGFRVRITALTPNAGNGDVTNLTINSSPQLNSHLRIKSTSRTAFTNQQQALLAIVPWSVPLSSLFDFVIFSERNLTKNLPQSKSDEIRTFGPYAFTTPGSWQDAASTDQSIDSAIVNPFLTCNTAQCQYYIRVINNTGIQQNYTVQVQENNNPIPPSQNANYLASGASCILPTSYTFNTGGHPPSPAIQIQFSANAQYQILSHVTYKDPTEGPCVQ